MMEKKIYRSRISVTLVVIMALVCFGMPVFFMLDGDHKGDVGATVICVAIFVIFMVLLYCIKYVIDGETLKVYYFPGIHTDIDIKSIRKMEPSRNPLSSPAGSLKRLAVHYGKYDMVLISPRHQEDFIKDIEEIVNKTK